TLAAQSKGKVIRKIFSEGDIVEKDQILYELDRKEISKKVRSARVSYMELLEKYDRLKNWETSLEVMQAKRKFDLSKIALSDEKKKLQETRKLLKKGIIPRIEYEQAQTAFKRLDYDFQNARQSLEQIQAKGNPDKLEVLRLQLFNAREELDELERNYEGAFVRAPVTGVVMRPVAGDGNIRMFKNEGDLVSAGDLMATIGATDSYIIASVVGEYAVNHLHVAQAVKISSFALPGITLPGEVQWVATQAKQNQGMHYFPVRLVIPTVPDSVRRALRLGALAEVEIVVREMPDVLTLPIEAVFRYQGGNQVYIIDSTGQQQLKTVTTGYSDNKKIIIKSGLVEGEEVFIPREVK
ncbi:MAG: efflux RND transporter periplasmic adaptor subunit, partial [Methanosarcinaceae archaeon]